MNNKKIRMRSEGDDTKYLLKISSRLLSLLAFQWDGSAPKCIQFSVKHIIVRLKIDMTNYEGNTSTILDLSLLA